MSETTSSPSPPSTSTSTSSTTNDASAPLSFDIVWSVWTARQGNGIRADDYNRYRQYCSRRLRRLRRAHDNQLHNCNYKKNKSSASSSSSSSSGVGKSRVVDVPRVEDGVVLAVPLFLSERAWAHAVALQQEVSNGAPARRNVHRIKRLATAVRYATTLVEVAALRFDARTKLEAAAYHLTLNGYHDLATRHFLQAAQHFQQALDVYERLSPISSPSVSEVCQARVEELTAARRLAEHQHKISMQVQPSDSSSSSSSLLSSASNLCPAASTLLSSLSVELESLVLTSQSSHSLNAVEWLGRDIPVTDDKLKQLLRDAKQLQQQLDQLNQHDDAALRSAVPPSSLPASSTSASSSSSSLPSSSASSSSVFSLLMNAYASCLSVIKSELSELKAETTKRHLILLQQFVTHQRLTATYQRNMRTALSMHLRYQQLLPSSSSSTTTTSSATTTSSSSSSSPSPAMKKVRALDLVGVYSRLQHNMLELGELAKTTGAPQIKAQAELLSSIFAAARCFFVAEAYERQGNFSEAAALFQRAHDKSKAALDSLLPVTVPDKELLVPQVSPLIEKSVQRMIVCQANTIIQQQQRQQQPADSSLLLPPSSPSSSLLHDALSPAASSSSSSSSSVLPSISFPPPVSAMTVKPIMFDLASQLITYPDLSKRFASKSSQPSRPPQLQSQQPPQQQPSPPPQQSPSNEDASKQGQKGFFGWFRR